MRLQVYLFSEHIGVAAQNVCLASEVGLTTSSDFVCRSTESSATDLDGASGYNLASLARIGGVMGDRWQLQEAKNRLSELVRKAREEGPQVITVHGQDAAVIVSTEHYRKLHRRKGSLVEFFRKSPLVGVKLDLSRSRDTGREMDL